MDSPSERPPPLLEDTRSSSSCTFEAPEEASFLARDDRHGQCRLGVDALDRRTGDLDALRLLGVRRQHAGSQRARMRAQCLR
jgi:hypothetical protein